MEIIVNICIGFVAIIGFFIFWGKSEGWFKENGIVYEWWQKKKASLKNKKHNKK